ncbi:M48 family peptidase [Paracoccus tegillarcae]|uniref:M48 family peptidase n=2 Tax=Paracoccus tegillarcae TaxID=1529068 RepID=A0A2K9ENQ1_9RHOB|nr:M48 family peptidase [Paracoccus tegillarcae]
MTLRVARHGGEVVLTLPPRISADEGRAFAETKSGWLRQVRARMPEARIAAHGAVLPVAGQGLLITPSPLSSARIAGEALLVPENRAAGPVVRAFLKHQAQQALLEACTRHAAALGKPFRAIALRDTRSRWGSCTSDARLMFSWRLAMAPYPVLDYVAAHEVAHLAHMDHSPRFWAAVERLMPGYAPQRAWLRQQGDTLLAWRFGD